MRKLLATIILFMAVGNVFATDYKLIFFYSPSCAYCHLMAPQLQQVAYQYRLDLVGNSIEEQFIEGFAENINDLSLFRKYKIYGMPTLVLHNARTQDGFIVARGAILGEELLQKLQEVASAINNTRYAS